MHALGWSFYQQGKHDKLTRGESLYRRMLEICTRTREDVDLTATAMNGLAAILRGLERHEEALGLQEKVLELRRKTSGPTDPKTSRAKHNLALSLLDTGKLKEAEPLLREVFDQQIKDQPRRSSHVEHDEKLRVVLAAPTGPTEEAGTGPEVEGRPPTGLQV